MGRGTVMLRRDGGTWSRVEAPHVRAAVNDVAGASDNDVWAVGYIDTDSRSRWLTMHWDGSAWDRVPNPTENAATAVTQTSAGKPWVAGSSWPIGVSAIERYDG
jgi:hypothetical protein